MIENATIITKGGLVLWTYEPVPLKGNPVNEFVKQIVLQDRGAEKSFTAPPYTIKWIFDNPNQLIFIVIYISTSPVYYAEDLLEVLKRKFVEEVYPSIVQSTLDEKTKTNKYNWDKLQNFAETFKVLQVAVEKRHQERRSDSSKDTEEERKKLEQLALGPRRHSSQVLSEPASPKSPSQKGTPKGKQQRKWEGSYDKGIEEELDKSVDKDVDYDKFKEQFLPDEKAKVDLEMKANEEDIEKYLKDDSKQTKSLFGSLFNNIVSGGKILDEATLNPVLDKFQVGLQDKNVNAEVAKSICQSVKESLIGQKVGTFASVYNKVKEVMTETLTRILTPNRNIDVLRDIMEVNSKGKPYSIVMVGVNGVGKSTSLAKICFWLQQNNKKVLIAACDTFRSGAVEQLGVHSRCLQVPLYQKGYGKEPAEIAKDALTYAEKERVDVVMIDTAGRMQDNENLMKALIRLIQVNSPNLVLFVGEALVGNDGVDQLDKFNSALRRLAKQDSSVKRSNMIDGVMLTKFDTIDDKVGAAISMVYSTGIPILFLGVGQQYTDLKKLSVNAVVNSLMT